ncbi:MAG TPA: hypothetical protein VHM25_21735 [Polyangiaceae bacterium]|nr:hypothetical protein [Polyangiaceae bacterium]
MMVALLGASCQRYWVCDDVDASQTAQLPQRLSDTGLYADLATGELAPGVLAYTPQFELWSDGAEKRRWILLPPDRPIDTSDMDEWLFPEGTKVWKQFSVGGVRIETRLLEKRGPGDADWLSLAYVWAPDDHDAIAEPLGAIDSHHTDHDVPAAGECLACHAGRRSFILGFSAIQLAASAAADEVDLDRLIQRGWLSHPPDSAPVVPGNTVEAAALGYLHANCSHCHNQTRPERGGARCFDPQKDDDFTLEIAQLDDVQSTPTYRTVVGHAVTRGNPDDSKLYELVSSRGLFKQMPPLATEHVDSAAVANLRQWIEGL